ASDIPVFREIGGDSMAYFGLSDPSTLANLVKQFESTGSFSAKWDLAKWKWLSWKDSADQFISRVQRNTQPVASGGSGARRAWRQCSTSATHRYRRVRSATGPGPAAASGAGTGAVRWPGLAYRPAHQPTSRL